MTSFASSMASLIPLAAAAAMSDTAPATPSESTLAIWWIVGLAGAAVIINNLFSLWGNLTGRFKEREQVGPEYVTREACHAAHEKTENTIRDMEDKHEERFDKFREEIRMSIVGVHKRVDQVLAGVSRLEGRTEKI